MDDLRFTIDVNNFCTISQYILPRTFSQIDCMKKVTTVSIVVLLLFIYINAHSQKLGKEILAAHNKFQKMVLARDSINIGSLYIDEAVSIRQNEAIRKGRTAIVERWSRAFRMSFALHTSMQGYVGEVRNTDISETIGSEGSWKGVCG